MKKLFFFLGFLITSMAAIAQGVKISAMPTLTDQTQIQAGFVPIVYNFVNYKFNPNFFALKSTTLTINGETQDFDGDLNFTVSGGSASRFGVTGEDDAASQNRSFNLSTFLFSIVAGNSTLSFSDGSMLFEQSDGTSIGRVYGSYGTSGIYAENASNVMGLEFNTGAGSASFLMDASTQLWMGTSSGTWDWEMRGLQTCSSCPSDVFYYDPATHDVFTGPAPTGGGGGSYTADNGVSLSSTTFQLGSATQGASTLTAIRYIDALTSRLEINGTGTYTFRATTTSNRAISGEASGAGIGVTGIGASGFAGIGVQGTADNASGIGVQGNSIAGSGIQGITETGFAGSFIAGPSSTNTLASVIKILRSTTGTAADGIGGYISFWMEYSSPTTTDEASRIGSTFTDISTRTSDLNFFTKNSNSLSEVLTLKGSGQIYAGKYGLGNFTGTAAYDLAVDASGHIIEVTAGGGGGGGSNTFSNALTLTGSAVTWEGALTKATTVSSMSNTNTVTFSGSYTGSGTVFTISNSSSGSAFGVTNNGGSSTAIIQNNSNGNALSVTGTSGQAINASTTSGSRVATFSTNPSSTNTTVNILELTRQTSGTAAASMGGAIQYNLEVNDGVGNTTALSTKLTSMWTDATNASRTAKLVVQNVNNATNTDIVEFLGDGNVRQLVTGKGYGLKSPDGTIWYITINNSGVISTSTTAP